jgi:hypothetical protein
LLIPTLGVVKYVKWEGDEAITHNRLHMCDDAIARDVFVLDGVIACIDDSVLSDVCIECGVKNTFGISVYSRESHF